MNPTTRFVVFDFETTGLEPDARIVELAAAWVDVQTGKVMERRHDLIDPQRSIPSATTGLHGITDDMVRGKPTIAAVLPRFLAFLARGPAVAHYALFDVQRLTFEAQRTGVALPGTVPVFCSIEASRAVFPNEPSRSLLNLARSLGLHRDGVAHRAAGDVSLTAQLVTKCLRKAACDLTALAPAVAML